MKVLERTGFVAMLLCVALIPSAANALQVSAGFLSPDPQIFPIGELVDINQINEGGDLGWDSFPEIIFVQISDLQGNEGDTEAYVRIYLNANGTPLLDWISEPFILHEWVDNSPGGTGRYTNPELSQIDFTSRDNTRSYEASVNEFLGLLDGANLASNLFTLGIEVHEADSDLMPGGNFRTTIQVYNPSPPTCQNPIDGEIILGYPVFFSWNWTGGMIAPQDVRLIIVEVPEGEEGTDPQEVIDNRSLVNTRFDGHPMFADYHTYTGAGMGEQAFQPGKTYCWTVEITVNTVISGGTSTFEAVPSYFVFSEAGEEGGAPLPGSPDVVFEYLGQVLPEGVMDALLEDFDGYQLNGITFDGLSGRSLGELLNRLNTPGLQIIDVTTEP